MDILKEFIAQVPFFALLIIFFTFWVRNVNGSIKELKKTSSDNHDAILNLKKDMEFHQTNRNDLKIDLAQCLKDNKDLNNWYDRVRKIELKNGISPKEKS